MHSVQISNPLKNKASSFLVQGILVDNNTAVVHVAMVTLTLGGCERAVKEVGLMSKGRHHFLLLCKLAHEKMAGVCSGGWV